MKIPTSFHWNGKDYKVMYEKNLDGGDSWGRTSFGPQEIRIEQDIHPQKQHETFIHELLHIAYRNSGLSWENKEEERAVKAWSNNIHGILKDAGVIK